MANSTAIYDACVLYPYHLRDLLVRLAREDMFYGRWTEAIHDEWIRNVAKNRPDLPQAQLERTRSLMNQAVFDCLITDYENLIPGLSLPDADDRHVLAAAIKGRADVIVTFNLSDFPASVLSQYNIEAQEPDVFVKHLLDLFPKRVCKVVKEQREDLKRPPVSVDELLTILERQRLPLSVEHLRSFRDIL